MVETLVTTDGCYVGIFDLASRVHHEETFLAALHSAKAAAAEAGQGWAALYYLNDQILEWSRRGEILTWIVLFDGCFKAHVKVCEPTEELVSPVEQTSAFLAEKVFDLQCPTGRLAIASLHELGNLDLQPTLEVEPGIYRASLVADIDLEADHWFLQEQEYRAVDDPVWRITIKRVGDLQ